MIQGGCCWWWHRMPPKVYYWSLDIWGWHHWGAWLPGERSLLLSSSRLSWPHSVSLMSGARDIKLFKKWFQVHCAFNKVCSWQKLWYSSWNLLTVIVTCNSWLENKNKFSNYYIYRMILLCRSLKNCSASWLLLWTVSSQLLWTKQEVYKIIRCGLFHCIYVSVYPFKVLTPHWNLK